MEICLTFMCMCLLFMTFGLLLRCKGSSGELNHDSVNAVIYDLEENINIVLFFSSCN